MEATGKTYIYHFHFPDGCRKVFPVALAPTAHYRNTDNPEGTEWTRLTHNRCPNCQLREKDSAHCPVAVNIAGLVKAFQDMASYDRCTVSCVCANRRVSKDTDVQDGLRSIMGIIMATSGCPALDMLRPMAWFHLPFANIDETLFRAASTYLLRQYFHAQAGSVPDFSLDKIREHYLHVEQVNQWMLKRVQHATELDADRNAIIILDNLARILGMEVDTGLESLRQLFC